MTIRADFFDKEVINKIISKSEQSYSYHWDGLLRHPKIYDLIPFFKKFYIFDKEDVAEKKTFLITNFYLDCYEDLFEDPILEYDVYFVGSNDSRIERLITICNYLKSKKLKLKIILYGEIQEWLKKYDYLTFIREPMSYLDNLKMISKSKILLDINHLHLHSGLSFRIFESLGYNKKLLTTNDLVMKYDFYNGNNIFVIDNNLEKIDSFLDNKIIHIKSSIKNKYSFTNWIKNVLEIKNNSI